MFRVTDIKKLERESVACAISNQGLPIGKREIKEIGKTLEWQGSVTSLFEEGQEDVAVELARQGSHGAPTNTYFESTATETWKSLVLSIADKDPQRAMSHVLSYLVAEEWVSTKPAEELMGLLRGKVDPKAVKCACVALHYK